MADHLRLAEGYRLVQMPPSGAPAHGQHPLRTLQPYQGSGPDSGLRPRGTPQGPPPPPPPPGTLAYGAFGSPTSFQHFPAMPPPAHLQPGTGTLYHPGRATAPPQGVPGAPPGLLQPPAGAPTPPAPALALGGMDAELIDEEALSSLELELGLHRVRELPELFLGQSEFDCFSDLGAAAPPAGSVSC